MFIKNILRNIYHRIRGLRYKNISSTSTIGRNVTVTNPDNLIMEKRTNISADSRILNSRARFILKRNSGAAIGLTVITGNHMLVKGKFFKDVTNKDKDSVADKEAFDKDVIVDEDAWIAANVTLLAGVHIGRGAVVGSGAVVRGFVPPYATVIGNPAKVIGFRMTPEDIIEHERILYPENERINPATLEKNYQKYFLNRISEINKFIKL